MIYLTFTTKALADTAQSIITQNSGFNGSITSIWALPTQTVAGTWAFLKPEAQYMTGVTGYIEVNDPAFPLPVNTP